MGQIILITRFRTYSGGSTVNVAPTALSAISRPLGGGATIENFGSIIANAVGGQTGLYYVELTDASYVDGTQYEVYCTATVSGRTVYGIQEFQFRALTADTTPPAPPTLLSLSAVGETSITVAFTPPTDADYSTCEFIAHCLDGGADGSVDSAASPAVIPALTPGNHYVVTATAVDTSGNRSEPVLLLEIVRTAAAAAEDDPMWLYWYLDRSATPHASCPVAINAGAAIDSGKVETAHVALHAGQIKVLRLRTYYAGPTADPGILGFAIDYDAPTGRPMGRGQE